MADSIALDIPDGVYGDVPGWSGMIRHPDILAMTAGAYPVRPPSTWFDNPGFRSLTPLTVEDDGRVYGHIAAWHTSHIGMAGGVKPPRSRSNYAYFRTGVVPCDDGKKVNVGQITLTGGHAPLNAGVSKAVAHYDDTASAIMDVAAGEDKYGIWVAGALRPDVTESQVRAIMASSVSGDWRPINGKLELVAICAVNAPGFPIPRARVASGAPIAIVAAGIEPLVEIAMNDRIESNVEQGIRAGLELFRERLLRVESVVLANGADYDEEKPAVDADQLRKRVRGGSALAASLRERVRGPKHDQEVVDEVEALAAALRTRVKGSDARPKGPAPEALTAARRPWNEFLHPRGADGRFIEVNSWVRWLRKGFGTTRRGQVKEIIPDPDSGSDGIPTRAMARVEFPALNDKTIIHDVPVKELEVVAPPKGSVSNKTVDADEDKGGDGPLSKKIAAKAVGHLVHDDEHHVRDDDDAAGVGTEDGNDTLDRLDPAEQEEVKDAVEEAVGEAVAEATPNTPAEDPNPTDEQLEAEEIADLNEGGGAEVSDKLVDGLIETPYVPPSDEWQKTSEWFEELQEEDTPVAEALVEELHPDAFKGTSEWADAVRLARARYEGWRASQLESNPEADVSLDAYLDWLEEKGLKAALVAGLRADARVRGAGGVLGHATSYWTEDKRREAAAKGHALPNGDYPIDDVEDLRRSIDAYGRAKLPDATKRHLIKRADMLGSLGLLPDGWVGRSFDPAKHMRGPDGKFISQGKTASGAPDAVSDVERLRGRVHGAA